MDTPRPAMLAVLMASLLSGCVKRVPDPVAPADPPDDVASEDDAAPNPYCAVTQPAPVLPPPQGGVLPYTLTFREVPPSDQPLPALHSTSTAVTADGKLVIVGGRYAAGLHGFTTSDPPTGSATQPSAAPLPPVCSDVQGSSNFANPNCYAWLIDPSSGSVSWVDLRPLAQTHPELYYPLTSTNQQDEHQGSTLLIIGGYGTDPTRETWLDFGGMGTFDTALKVDVEQLASAIAAGSSADDLAGLFQIARDDAFAVTGGGLATMQDGYTYLMGGQRFDGNYMAFDDGGKVSQTYTQEVRRFRLQDDPFGVQGTVSALTLDGADKPLHRRDGNFGVGVDPATSQPRLTIFGGVFKPGAIAAYDQPIWGTVGRQTTTLTQDAFVQRFAQYESPVVQLWDGSKAYATFFGGIGGHFGHETAYQSTGRCNVTTGYTGVPGDVDRNDGFPFTADISTVACDATGCLEWISPDPIPPPLGAPPPPPPQTGLPPDAAACETYDYAQVQSNYGLRGASTGFLADPRSGVLSEHDVVQLDQVQGDVRIGWVFGGIQAALPLPRIPNRGTFASNALYEVWVSPTPAAGIPAAAGFAPTWGCSGS